MSGAGVTRPVVELFTDGACLGNPGPGGWGALLRAGSRERELSGGEPMTTNNRMELMAAIAGLEALTRPCEVVLTTDSQYVKLGVEQWIARWQANGWRTSDRKPVKNQDLWERLPRAGAPPRERRPWGQRGGGGRPAQDGGGGCPSRPPASARSTARHRA